MTKPLALLSPRLIRYTRQAMQMTQAEFGEYLGVERNTVTRWEMGIHLPVGRRAKTILQRYNTARRHEKLAQKEAEGEVPGSER